MFFFGLIVGVVLVIAAIANMILTNLSDIISVLASFIFLGWTIIQTAREIELPDPLREAYRSLWNENSNKHNNPKSNEKSSANNFFFHHVHLF